ncbi:MAG: C-GCAxxG-C-C family protein [Saccharofermentanales bacterium]|jgi:C_GCAxxG_C_C family probable redox protein
MDQKPVDIEFFFHKGGFNCAESVFRVLCARGVIDAPVEYSKILSGFGGGMQQGYICGAIVGGVMALGWVYGRTNLTESRDPSACAVKEFLARFKERFGEPYECDTLREHFMPGEETRSPEMYRQCASFVGMAVDIVTDIVKRPPYDL